MRRILPMIAVAAVALSASNVFAVAELLQQFGAPYDGMGVPAVGPGLTNPDIQAMRGQTLNIPIWMTPLRGDHTSGAFTVIRTFNFEASGIATGNGGFANFTMVGSTNRNIYANCVNQGAAAAGDPDSANLPGSQLLFQRMGCNPAPADNGMRSDGMGLAPDGGTASYFIGYYTISIPANATIGATLDVYMHTPLNNQVPPAADPRYTSNASPFNIGYGMNGANPNDERLIAGVPSALVLGTLYDQVSTIADMRITIVPEPATIGLLAVAVLGLRRRLA